MAIARDAQVLAAYGSADFIDFMKAAYFAIPLATAFSLVSLPAGAETRLGLELVRIREGAVKPLPVLDDIQAIRTQPPTGQANIGNLIAQSNPSGEGGPSGVRNISPTDTSFSITFECSLVTEEQEPPPPAIPGLWMFLPLIERVDLVNEETGEVIKTYSSGQWTLGSDNTVITFDISDVEKLPGNVYRFDFYPAGPCDRVDERRFRVPAVAAPAATGGGSVLPYILGAAAVAVGICALAGCFDGGRRGRRRPTGDGNVTGR